MKIRVQLPTAWCLALGLLTTPLALHAQLPKIFVASFGNDANDGSRNSPKRNFQAAHNAVAVGGQIVVLDTAGYGLLSITKSVSVTVPPGVNGFITTTGGASGITINITSSGVGNTVSLRGLIIESSSNGGYGIRIFSCGTVEVDDCVLRNFSGGILCSNSIANGHLFVRGGSIRQCSDGIEWLPAAAGQDGVIRGCDIESMSASGLLASNGNGGTANILVADCTIANCGTSGINAQDGGALFRVENCRIFGNDAGVSIGAGGQVASRGNNTLEHNTSGNTFPNSYGAK